jgi:hypothetical protein
MVNFVVKYKTGQKNIYIAYVAMAIWSVLMLAVAVKGGIQHDHSCYLMQWRLVLDRADPWSTDNAYGPLHNLLAFFLPLSQICPKLIIVTALLLTNLMLFYQLAMAKGIAGIGNIYVITVPTNLLVIIMGFVYGLNDALVAAFIIAAIITRYHDRILLSGIFLGLATLLKFYPIFLVPLFALDDGRFKLGILFWAAVVVTLGFLAAFFIWGEAFLSPIFFGVSRHPKLLSVLSALTFYPSLIGGQNVLDFLIRTNSVFVIGVAFLSTVISFKFRVHWLEASVVGLLMILTAYKTGHQQFYIPWLFLVAALPLAETDSAKSLIRFCIPFAIFLSVFELGHFLYNGTATFQVVRQYVGFFAFCLSVTTVSAYFLTFYKLHNQAESHPSL